MTCIRSLRIGLSAGVLIAIAAPSAPTQDPAAAAPPPAAELARGFEEARDAWNKELREASRQKDDAAMKRLRANPPGDAFAPRFEAGARHHRGTEAAVPYLVWLVQRGPRATSTAAMATLMDEHIESPGIRLAVARIGGLKKQFGVDRSRAWLDAALEHNRDPMVQAQARYTRAAMYVGTRAVATSDELRQLAIADLRAAIAQLDGDDGASLRGLATRLLDEAERLEPGCVAPDIEGRDLDGVEFRLRDYRGKVVLLDFWGDW